MKRWGWSGERNGTGGGKEVRTAGRLNEIKGVPQKNEGGVRGEKKIQKREKGERQSEIVLNQKKKKIRGNKKVRH